VIYLTNLERYRKEYPDNDIYADEEIIKYVCAFSFCSGWITCNDSSKNCRQHWMEEAI
jgi:hypothetical protein